MPVKNIELAVRQSILQDDNRHKLSCKAIINEMKKTMMICMLRMVCMNKTVKFLMIWLIDETEIYLKIQMIEDKG